MIESYDGSDGTENCLMHFFRFNEDGGEVVLNSGNAALTGFIVDEIGNQVFREDSTVPN